MDKESDIAACVTWQKSPQTSKIEIEGKKKNSPAPARTSQFTQKTSALWEYVRERSCLLLCSLRLKAREQYWHLYFLSGACEIFPPGAVVGEAAADAVAGAAETTAGPGIVTVGVLVAVVAQDLRCKTGM